MKSTEDATDSNAKAAEAPIELPVLEYGYRTQCMEWAELKDIILVQQDLAKLTRSVEQQTEYERFKRSLKQSWRSVLDHILSTKFGLERRVDAVSGLAYAYPPLSQVQEQKFILVRNDFPYYTALNVDHYVLWKLHGECTMAEIQQAKHDIQSESNVVDCLHWINPPHLKSLPDIDHVHILCLRRTKDES